jgi:hypothetical protein
MAFIIGGGITIGPGISFIDGALPAANDPYFEYVATLLSDTGSNNANNNVFVDSSTNNSSITRFGNTTQGAVSPYDSGWSNYFDGTGDYLTLPTTSGAFNFGTGNFTIEMWIRPDTVAPAYQQLAGSTYSTTGGAVYLAGSTLTFYTNGVNAQSATNSINANQWQHIAVVRNSGVLKTYINGVEAGSVANTQNLTNATGQIGLKTGSTTVEPFKGYISNLRVVKAAVYTTNFTPSTAPLTAIADTSLLTCQSNRFIDNSTNNFAITRSGDTKVERFNPFGLTTAYTPQELGGSIYCDGNGDYLQLANAVSNQMGSGDWTAEAWVYITSYSLLNAVFAKGGSTTDWFLGTTATSGRLYFGVSTTDYFAATGPVVPINTWSHVALVRSGTTLSTYLNGVLGNTQTGITQNFASTGVLNIGRGRDTSTNYLSGYISNSRLVKGTAVYTANFTPPTQPLTSITNTSLLLNGTNAGIYDASTLNNLETLGDIKTSTAISKWGTSSVAFDGNGDYLSIPYSPMFSQTGPYTVEGWFYPTSTASAVQALFARNAGGYFGIVWTGSTLKVDKHGVGIQINGTTTLALNTWHHWAMTFDGTTTRLFANGILQGSVTGTGGEAAAATTIGYYTATPTSSFYGYMSDFRFTRGVARYTANFTPPTEAFPLY